MNVQRVFLLATLLLLTCASMASAQDESPNPAGAPPKMLLLVHQEINFGRAAERRKLEIASAHAYDQWKVPISWIDLESITGPPQALFLDPLASFVFSKCVFTLVTNPNSRKPSGSSPKPTKKSIPILLGSSIT